jgi:hypothetical protein
MITTRALLFRVTAAHPTRLTTLASFSFARSVKPPTTPSTPSPPKQVKASDFEVFDPKASKYGLPREEQVKKTHEKRKDAPEYLRNEQNFIDLT